LAGLDPAWFVACDLLFWDDLGMAKGYRRVDRDQGFLLPPDMREWLPGDHPVWLVIGVVEDHLDTSAFHAGRRAGGAGAAGFDPDMLAALLIWAYACGVTSSRKIEAACRQDVAFRVICAGDVPDHVTIARFRAASGGAAEVLFAGVLGLCARLGMGRVGTVALDGMKIAASASKSANRTEARLRELAARRVAEHAAADAAEDELFGAGRRGDEVPAEAACPATRDERIRRALAELEAGRKAAEAGREQKAREYLEAGGRGPGAPPRAAAVEAARARLERARAARAAQLAEMERRAGGPAAPGRRRRRARAGVEDFARVAAARDALAAAETRAAEAGRRAAESTRRGPGPVRNITDPDSRLMPVRGGGFIQGYNAQNVTSSDGLIIATQLTADTTDMQWLEPMLAAAIDAAALITARQPAPAAGQHGGIDLFLADAGYCSEHNLTLPGPDRLIATGKHRDLEKAARQAGDSQAPAGDGPVAGPVAAMAARLATPEGITAYRQRGHIAETPHGHIKHNMRFRQLSLRGKRKAAAEWTFTCAVHNLFKAITTGHLTPATLAALAS
jgi:transposase